MILQLQFIGIRIRFAISIHSDAIPNLYNLYNMKFGMQEISNFNAIYANKVVTIRLGFKIKRFEYTIRTIDFNYYLSKDILRLYSMYC